MSQGRVQTQRIASWAETADEPDASRRGQRRVPEWLAGVDVGEMHLHRRQRANFERVANRNAGMRIAARVDDDGGKPVAGRRLDAGDDLPLQVALPAFHLR